ncbi:hypothetical protein L7F22_019450 [Adiantum nelumboides]|nr:hypothetical protein [Adiantum nelumboides]
MVRKNEQRQRGKKHKSRKEEEQPSSEVKDESIFVEDRIGTLGEQEDPSTSSWMIDRSNGPINNGDSTPFGLVEPDLKAYLRSAHVTFQEHITSASEEGRVLNKDEDIKALRNAMLDEIKGKELVLATDTDTSIILEDMMSTFGDRQLRILAEALTQQSVTLVCHRFGSHVIQTLLSALQYFAMQANVNDNNEEGQGLRSCQQFIVDISESIRQQVGDIFGDQFASHVLRSLFLILSGKQATVESVRSKRSKKFHQKTQLTSSRPWSDQFETHQPVDFKNALSGLLHTLQSTLNDAQKVREMCISPTLSPTIALIIELAAKQDTNANKNGKSSIDFLDASLDGLVSKEPEERSAHIETLLRDSVGSHFLEAVLKVAPHTVVQRFWKHYLAGRLGKLGTHPTANFVVSGAIRLLDTNTLEQACEEVREEGEKLVKARHLGPFVALTERAGELAPDKNPSSVSAKAKKSNVWNADRIDAVVVRSILTAFGISETDNDDKDGGPIVIDVLLNGKTLKEYKKAAKAAKKAKKDAKKAAKRKRAANDEEEGEEEAENGSKEEDPKSTKADLNLQGSLLCQSILRLSEPAHSPIFDNLLEIEDRHFLSIACDPIGVHVPLAAVQSSNLPFASRSKFSAKILTLLIPLLSDKFGSRLMDAIFDVSDLFFREKVARACLGAERTLLSTPYGRYFFKRIHIALFRKDIVQWKQHLRTIQEEQRNKEQQSSKVVENAQEPIEKVEKSRKKQKRSQVDEDLDAILSKVE